MFEKILLVHDSPKGKLASFDVLIKDDLEIEESLKEFLDYLEKIFYSFPDCPYVRLFKKKFKGYEYVCSEDFCHQSSYSEFGGADEEIRELTEKYGFKPVYITDDGDVFILSDYNLDIVRGVNEYNRDISFVRS